MQSNDLLFDVISDFMPAWIDSAQHSFSCPSCYTHYTITGYCDLTREVRADGVHYVGRRRKPGICQKCGGMLPLP